MTQEQESQPQLQRQTQDLGRLVLLFEEDASFAKTLRPIIERYGFQVTVAPADEIFTQAKARQPYLILLGVGPKADGLKLCAELKASPYTNSLPVVLLSTALPDEGAELKGFAEGADDYVFLPASDELFGARLRAVLRRYSPPVETSDSLQMEGLTLDTRARKVFVKGKLVALTRKEFDLLATFLRRRGQVVYTTHLYHTVWGYGESAPVDSHTVKVHVSSLRSKLGPDLGRKIVNLPGLGYRFDT